MVDFSNKWYRETCEEEGLNPDNELSKSEVELAKQAAVNMQKYMRAKKSYEDDGRLHKRLDEQIKRLDEVRVEHMLNALNHAQIMDDLEQGSDKGFNQFLKSNLSRRERLLNR